MKKLSYWVALLGLLPMAVLLGQPLKKQTTTMKQAPQPTQQQVQKTSQPQAPQQAAQTEISEKEELQKLSEAFGHFIGSNLSRPGIEFDIESMIKGIRDGAAGKPGPLPEKDYQTLLMKYQEKGFKKVSEQNLNAANNFLNENKSKPGVKEIEPGKLQYLVIKQGTGNEVKEGATPEIRYTGKLIDGQVFSSSTDAATGTITIPLAQAIPGFQKGLLGMKEGESRRLFIHPDLAYGVAGHLPPNSLLIFDIEIVKADTPKSSQESDDETAADDSSDDEDDGEDESDDEGETQEHKK